MQAGLDEVVQAMAMPAAQLGDNLEHDLKRNEPEDSKTMPPDLAFHHVNEEVHASS